MAMDSTDYDQEAYGGAEVSPDEPPEMASWVLTLAYVLIATLVFGIFVLAYHFVH